MKICLTVALFLSALVVAHSLEEEGEKVEQPNKIQQDDIESPPATEGDTRADTEEDEDEDEDEDVDVDEDEDPEKRRIRNTLSTFSCIQLKRRGYCRHAFIRNLCRLTCRTPCVDQLSSLSCGRIRAYRKCNLAIARLYCRRTCGHCGPNPCRRYRLLNQLNRRQSRGGGSNCDNRLNGWYRISGLAGNAMPTRPPPIHRCGTNAPGWMQGRYPHRIGQVVNRRVCFHWNRNVCRWSTFIKVKLCLWRRQRYFVFLLRRTPACHLRYCGNA